MLKATDEDLQHFVIKRHQYRIVCGRCLGDRRLSSSFEPLFCIFYCNAKQAKHFTPSPDGSFPLSTFHFHSSSIFRCVTCRSGGPYPIGIDLLAS